MCLILSKETGSDIVLIDETSRRFVKILTSVPSVIETDARRGPPLLFICLAACQVAHLLLLEVLVSSFLFLSTDFLKVLCVALPRIAPIARRVISVTTRVSKCGVL